MTLLAEGIRAGIGESLDTVAAGLDTPSMSAQSRLIKAEFVLLSVMIFVTIDLPHSSRTYVVRLSCTAVKGTAILLVSRTVLALLIGLLKLRAITYVVAPFTTIVASVRALGIRLAFMTKLCV